MLSSDSAVLGVVVLLSLAVAGYMWHGSGSGGRSAAGGRKRDDGSENDNDDDDRGQGARRGSSGGAKSQFQRSSYYYAHKGRELDDGVPRVWDGKAAPKLLRRAPSAGTPTDAAGSTSADAKPAGALPFSKYAFSDEGGKIKLYITQAGLDTVLPADIAFAWTRTSMRLTVRVDKSKAYVLDAPMLFGEISKASFKQKSGNRIVVTLCKTAPEEWTALHKLKPKKAVGDHDYA